ncbi:hypothetical protein [Kineobactrum salinum]|uniref:Uncharacterized protein n=1 Tax=Kineobactrum salinum TaxID=2708301 RepID=A0A6C0TY32_9GAMM|nr:hypothetical protein [Kineobactrum salinum]QIB64701.1 hypothetical protein G3T16_04155 [Kineobactrum salinum]
MVTVDEIRVTLERGGNSAVAGLCVKIVEYLLLVAENEHAALDRIDGCVYAQADRALAVQALVAAAVGAVAVTVQCRAVVQEYLAGSLVVGGNNAVHAFGNIPLGIIQGPAVGSGIEQPGVPVGKIGGAAGQRARKGPQQTGFPDKRHTIVGVAGVGLGTVVGSQFALRGMSLGVRRHGWLGEPFERFRPRVEYIQLITVVIIVTAPQIYRRPLSGSRSPPFQAYMTFLQESRKS